MDALKAVWILKRIPGFGIQKFKFLRDQVQDFGLLLKLDFLEAQLRKLGCCAEDVARFLETASSPGFERDVDACSQRGIRMISILDDNYPKNLSAIYDPPLIIYVKGDLISEDQLAVAIVGSRNASPYGLRMAGRFSMELASAGITVVSGFARGIDGEAHRNALRVKGRTLAVFGCGLDVIYPKEHAKLYEQTAESGALISEFPLGTPPLAFNFPMRNRIISGLSIGVLVVEAGPKSGSLITASIAAEEGREVYAVPGPVDQLSSRGTNELIQKGAKLVLSVSDVLEDLHPQLKSALKSLTEKEISRETHLDPIIKLLEKKPLSLDEMLLGLNLDRDQLYGQVTRLELRGLVKRQYGGKYAVNV